MRTTMRIGHPATFARSNRGLFNAFVELCIKLDELTGGDEFGGFEKLEVFQNESVMIHGQLGTASHVYCILTPKDFNQETGFGRIVISCLLYVKDGKALITHLKKKTPLIEGSTDEVISKSATLIVERFRTEACIGDKAGV